MQRTTTPSPRTLAGPAGGYGLVAIDLDGTLLRSDKRLSLRTVRAVREANRRGVKVVLASARPPRSVREIYRHLQLDTLQINYNGALIAEGLTGKLILHQTLCNRLAAQIVRRARQVDPKVCVSIEILDKWLTDRVDKSLLTETAKAMGPDFVGPLDQCLREPITKLMFLAPPRRLAPVQAMVQNEFGQRVALFVSDKHLLQICHPSVEKAMALAWIADHYRVPAKRCVAIGDAPNDIGMIHWAGLGIAVGNAWEQTKAAADVIVASNDDDGVAEAIRRFVLHGEPVSRGGAETRRVEKSR